MFAGTRPLNAFHLPGAAADLPLILTGLNFAIFRGHRALIGVENFVAAIKCLHVNAPNFG